MKERAAYRGYSLFTNNKNKVSP